MTSYYDYDDYDGGGLSSRHIRYCLNKYQLLQPAHNTWVAISGRVKQCYSPYYCKAVTNRKTGVREGAGIRHSSPWIPACAGMRKLKRLASLLIRRAGLSFPMNSFFLQD